MFRHLPAQDRIVLSMVFFEGLLGVLAALLGWIFGHPPIEKLHWSWAHVGIGALATVPAVVVMGCLTWIPWAPFVRILRFYDRVITPLLANASLAQLAVIAAVAGVAEEALFRGYAQMHLASGINPWMALAIASLLFGLVHFVTLTYAVLATLMGAYLGGLLVWFDNLLVPIVVHAVYDLLALVYVVRLRGARIRAAVAAQQAEHQSVDRWDNRSDDAPPAPPDEPPSAADDDSAHG